MSRLRSAVGYARVLTSLALLIGGSAARSAEPCADPVARVVSVQGTVDLRRSGAGWETAKLSAGLCTGDALRVSQRSRAALQLNNETTLRVDQGTTLTILAADDKGATVIDQVSGGLHIITRTPRLFRVRTPFVNANVEGTEFQVRVDESSAVVTVYEGVVSAANDLGTLSLTSGEAAVTRVASPPRKEITIRPNDAVQWTIHFQDLLDLLVKVDLDPSSDPNLSLSVQAYREGRLADALELVSKVPQAAETPQVLTYQAALLLLVGRLDEARPRIEQALARNPDDSRSYSLLTVIAIAQNDKSLALTMSQKAVASDADSAVARMARSYALQATFDTAGALESAQEAVQLDPLSALALARLAEMEMVTGHLDRAVAAAVRSVAIDPRLSRAQTILGFASLANGQSGNAASAFDAAIALDPSDPLPRLGGGLAKIRDGKLQEGRASIEIAVALDTQNSLSRSYLAKAYFEERRNHLAASQLNVAKGLDPLDPTPWFYDSILKQSENRPIEALDDLATSSALNQNRSVYRSQLLLDNDSAVRNTSRARTYSDLGFEELEVGEAVKSLSADRTDPSAHRFLSDYYASLPRHEFARDSELLQAQLLQPIATAPVFPRLGADGLNLFTAPLSSRPGFNEYGQAFERDGTHVTGEGILGNRGNNVERAAVYGLAGNVSFSLGMFRLSTDGFRENNDQQQLIGNAFVQVRLSGNTSVQAELRSSSKKFGDPAILFFSDQYLPNLRFEDKRTSVRLGLRTSTGDNGTLLATYSHRRLDFEAADETLFGQSRDAEVADFYEVSHVYRQPGWSLRTGLGVYRGTVKNSFTAPGEAEVISDPVSERRINAYTYGDIRLNNWSTAQIGVSFDRFDGLQGVSRNLVNPKIGLVLSPSPSTTIRASTFSTLKGPLVSEQTLEPTEVAGFNQFFDDDEGVVSRRVGVAVDHAFGGRAYAGFELSQRRQSRIPGPGGRETSFTEKLARAYFYKAFYPSVAVSVDPEFLDQKGEPDAFNDQLIAQAKTYRVPAEVRWFGRNGMFVRLRGTYFHQSGMFSDGPFQVAVLPGSSSFAVFDVGVGYRLPGRHGIVEVGVRNLTDRQFRFQDIDLRNPTIARRRLVAARVQVDF